MIQNGATILPPLMGEEQVVSGENLPDEFRLSVQDDSGGLDYPRGSQILWKRSRSARIGGIVLVKDKHNRLHIRRMQQGRSPSQWIASPLNPAFATLVSDDDGLTVVASFDGFKLPPD